MKCRTEMHKSTLRYRRDSHRMHRKLPESVSAEERVSEDWRRLARLFAVAVDDSYWRRNADCDSSCPALSLPFRTLAYERDGTREVCQNEREHLR